MSIFHELQRRNVIRVAIAYAIASWVLLQIVDVISPIFELPLWAPRLIFLLLAVGLVPTLIFAWVYEITPEGVKRESEIDKSTSIAGATGKKLNLIIAVSLVLAVGLLVTDRFQPTPDTLRQAAKSGEAGEQAPGSIAVLPFVNMSSDAEQEFFSDGITEEILNSLASVKELKVAGRTSSFAFKGQNDDLRRIGDALGVAHILEGSVRKAGDQVRITAQLIQVDNGFHMWSETYDRELTDIFAIQDEIAQEILRQLKTHLLGGEGGPTEAQITDPAVYALYLKAKQRIYTRTGTQIEQAIKELDEAIEMDPGYAPAYAQRGIATMLLSEGQYGSLPDSEANRRGKRFIDKALELNPNHAEAVAGLGLFYTKTPATYNEAIDVLEKALQLNPNSIDASNWLHIALNGVGDMRGSLEIVEELTDRDPLYQPAFSNAMQRFNSMGQPEKADALLARMEAFDPNDPELLQARATSALFRGEAGESLRLMEERLKIGPTSGVGQLYFSFGLIRTGQFDRATEEGSPYLRVQALYNVGRKAEAYEDAYRFAADGFPGDLFGLFLTEHRYRDLVNYLEERWPSVSAFEAENPGDEFGHDVVNMVAFAYLNLDESERFDEAMQLEERHLNKMIDQGVTNFVFSGQLAFHNAMAGDLDAAFEHLEQAVANGWVALGEPTEVDPRFSLLADDPRFAPIKESMLATLNRDRALVGLDPFEDYSEVLARTE